MHIDHLPFLRRRRFRRADEEFRANADTLAWLTIRLLPAPDQLEQFRPRFDKLFRRQEQLLDIMRATRTDKTDCSFAYDCLLHDWLGGALDKLGYWW
ncbi:MAG: hypothetical protein K2K30_09920 [Alistipes sp.]|nr:hypothetical protein [Alistipes sp.]